MAKNARSIKLNKAMKEELQIMVDLGLESAPISAASLHARMKTKGIVKGQQSVFSTPERKQIIEEYFKQQITNAEGSESEEIIESDSKSKYGSNAYLKERNQRLTAELDRKRAQLSRNTTMLVSIINRVEAVTAIRPEDLISQYLKASDFDPDEDVPF